MSSTSSASSFHSCASCHHFPLFKGPKFDYEGSEKRCECNGRGLKAPMRMSWTKSNPGIRFFNCPKVMVLYVCLIVVNDINCGSVIEFEILDFF